MQVYNYEKHQSQYFESTAYQSTARISDISSDVDEIDPIEISKEYDKIAENLPGIELENTKYQRSSSQNQKQIVRVTPPERQHDINYQKFPEQRIAPRDFEINTYQRFQNFEIKKQSKIRQLKEEYSPLRHQKQQKRINTSSIPPQRNLIDFSENFLQIKQERINQLKLQKLEKEFLEEAKQCTFIPKINKSPSKVYSNYQTPAKLQVRNYSNWIHQMQNAKKKHTNENPITDNIQVTPFKPTLNKLTEDLSEKRKKQTSQNLIERIFIEKENIDIKLEKIMEDMKPSFKPDISEHSRELMQNQNQEKQNNNIFRKSRMGFYTISQNKNPVQIEDQYDQYQLEEKYQLIKPQDKLQQNLEPNLLNDVINEQKYQVLNDNYFIQNQKKISEILNDNNIINKFTDTLNYSINQHVDENNENQYIDFSFNEESFGK